MATIDSSDFTTSDGWTLVTTNGTILFNQGSPGPYVSVNHKKISGSDWGTCGIYRTLPQIGTSGQVIYWKSYVPADSDFMMGISDAVGISFAGKIAIYKTQTNIFTVWDGSSGSGNVGVSSGNWYDCKLAINGDGTVTGSRKLVSSGVWDSIGSSTVVNTFDATANNIYFFTNLYTDDGFSWPIADWIYTDDGTPTPPPSPAGEGGIGSGIKVLGTKDSRILKGPRIDGGVYIYPFPSGLRFPRGGR